MPCIFFLFKRWHKLVLTVVLLVTLVHNLLAQNVPTFELTIPGSGGITNLQAIPGTNEFYAVSQKNYADRVAPLILKLDTAGNITRQIEYRLPTLTYIRQSKITANGGMVIIGSYSEFYNDNLYCLSLTAGGAVAWCKSFYLEGHILIGADIIETSNGDFVISGLIANGYYVNDAFLLKLDKAGSPIWMKRYKNQPNRNVSGGGIIQKKDTIVFCSSLETDDWPTFHDVRLSKVSLTDGNFLSANDLIPSGNGFGALKIYHDHHGGYYIRAFNVNYRSPCQTAAVLRLDSNLKLIDNYMVYPSRIPQGFGVLSDGTFNVGNTCFGYNPKIVSSTVTKVSTSGEVVFSAHYPDNPLLQISTAVSIGNQVFAAGHKNGKGFITALNNFRLSQNNCSLVTNDAKLERDVFTSIPGEWAAITSETVVATNLPVELTNLSLTTEMTSCIVPPVLYVDQQATGLNDGSSWLNAFTSLTDAINKMNVTMGVDSILVAAGTYTPNPNATFVFNKLSSVILGGYPTGGGTRNAAVNVVILQGVVKFEKSVRFDGFRME